MKWEYIEWFENDFVISNVFYEKLWESVVRKYLWVAILCLIRCEMALFKILEDWWLFHLCLIGNGVVHHLMQFPGWMLQSRMNLYIVYIYILEKLSCIMKLFLEKLHLLHRSLLRFIFHSFLFIFFFRFVSIVVIWRLLEQLLYIFCYIGTDVFLISF
jgi:hypothetical protein